MKLVSYHDLIVCYCKRLDNYYRRGDRVEIEIGGGGSTKNIKGKGGGSTKNLESKKSRLQGWGVYEKNYFSEDSLKKIVRKKIHTTTPPQIINGLPLNPF